MIGGNLLTLPILTLQHQTDGQVKFAMEIDKNWHFYKLWIICRSKLYFASIYYTRWYISSLLMLLFCSAEI